MSWTITPSFTQWTPALISTALWLDAADASTITTVSGAVSQWSDKSSNGRHATQSSSGLRPSVSTAALNGLDGILFNGNPYLLNTTAVMPLQVRSIFVVFSEAQALANTGLYVVTPPGGNDYERPDALVFGPSNRTTVRLIATGSTAASYDVRWTTSPGALIPATICGETKRAGYGELFINGTSVSTDSSFTEFVVNSGNGYIVGARYGSGILANFRLNGTVFEIIHCPSELSATDRQKMEGYLAHKWALTANLPAGHPYKVNPPAP